MAVSASAELHPPRGGCPPNITINLTPASLGSAVAGYRERLAQMTTGRRGILRTDPCTIAAWIVLLQDP
jgi:hypothetical protein